MPPLFGEIATEFAEIAIEVEHLAARLSRFMPGEEPSDPQERWEATHVCASATEKVFTGCERVMARLAAEIDDPPFVKSDAWHSALLRRMASPVPMRREAIISPACYALLDKLRSFRHRERNTYGIKLDFEIVLERAAEPVTAFSVFRLEVEAFLARDGDKA